MAVATVAEHKTGKKPHYKDYVSFLENYKNGKKEDHDDMATNDSGVSLSFNNSSNNSSSSVYSDLADPPKNSFKDYLENYNNKRYSSVQPPAFMKKQSEMQAAEPKTVKTEVFIEINNPPSTVIKVVNVNNSHNISNVSKVSKIFEKNENNVMTKAVPPSGKVNTFNFEQKDPETKSTQRKGCIGDTLKKLEGNHQKVTLKKANSISEKSKVFEDTTNTHEPRKSSAQEISKCSQNGNPKTNGCTSPKLIPNNTKPKIAIPQQREAETVPKVNGSVSPKPSISIKPVVIPKAVAENLILQHNEGTNGVPPVNDVKPVIVPTTLDPCPPLPPPLPQETSAVCSPPPPPPPVPNSAPPPPPPPPANFIAKKIQNSPPKSTLPVQKVVVNGVGAGQKKNDLVDGAVHPVVNKNDPRVKKLVYGALREMYGAYHDKANDYIATLPRNRVKKNNGLDSIIDSIASQGGLDKLTGRVNPSVDTD